MLRGLAPHSLAAVRPAHEQERLAAGGCEFWARFGHTLGAAGQVLAPRSARCRAARLRACSALCPCPHPLQGLTTQLTRWLWWRGGQRPGAEPAAPDLNTAVVEQSDFVEDVGTARVPPSHPVLQLIRERAQVRAGAAKAVLPPSFDCRARAHLTLRVAQARSLPGRRTDGFKLGLVVEGACACAVRALWRESCCVRALATRWQPWLCCACACCRRRDARRDQWRDAHGPVRAGVRGGGGCWRAQRAAAALAGLPRNWLIWRWPARLTAARSLPPLLAAFQAQELVRRGVRRQRRWVQRVQAWHSRGACTCCCSTQCAGAACGVQQQLCREVLLKPWPARHRRRHQCHVLPERAAPRPEHLPRGPDRLQVRACTPPCLSARTVSHTAAAEGCRACGRSLVRTRHGRRAQVHQRAYNHPCCP